MEFDMAYSIDADPSGIRKRAADAIIGALALGAQDSSPPPEGHWLQQFWDIGRAEASKATPPAAQPAPVQGPTEEILIDGIAYTVPAAVAAEMLRLHLAIRTTPPAQPAPVQDGLDADCIAAIVSQRYTPPAQPAPVQEPVGEVKNLFTQAAWEKLDVRGSTKVYLDTPPVEQPAPVQERIDLQFLKQVVGVAIAGLFEHYKKDVARVFDTSTLQDVAEETMNLGDQRVEEIYKRAWDMLNTTPPARPALDRTGMTYYKNDKCKALNSASHDCICWTPAAQRQWVGLTDEEVANFLKASWDRGVTPEHFIQVIEAKLKQKNAIALLCAVAPEMLDLLQKYVDNYEVGTIINHENSEIDIAFQLAESCRKYLNYLTQILRAISPARGL